MLWWHSASATPHLKHHAEAIETFEQCLTIDRGMGAHYWTAYVLDRLGDLHHVAGRDAARSQSWQESISIFEVLQCREANTVRTKIDALI